MFKATYLKSEDVKRFYGQAFVKLETLLLQCHLNQIIADEDQAEATDLRNRITALEIDFLETLAAMETSEDAE